MADKNGLDDIDDLLSGLDNDLVGGGSKPESDPPPASTPATSPATPSAPSAPAPKPATASAPAKPNAPAPKTNPNDDKIQDLLAGLDDAFFVGAGSPPSAAPVPAKPAVQPAKAPVEEPELPELDAPAAIPDESPLSGLDDLMGGLDTPSSPPAETGLDSSFDLPDGMASSPASDLGSLDIPGSAPAASAPDLDGFDLPEAAPADTAGFDLPGTPASAPSDESSSSLSDLSMDLPSADEINLDLPASVASTPSARSPSADLSAEEPMLADAQPEEPEPEDSRKRPGKQKRMPDLSEKQLRFIQMRVSHFGPKLREAVSRCIVSEELEVADLAALVQLILQKKSVQQIRDFLQKKTGQEIPGPLLDAAYSQHLRTKKKSAARRQRFQTTRQSPWELFLESLLPTLRPLLIFIVVLAVFFFFVYPPVRSSMLIGAGEKLIQTKNEENINLAEKKFLQALKVRPRFFDAYLRYADSYIANEYTEQASEKLKVYRDLKGENFEWLMATGRLLRSEGRLDGNDSASTFFERARRKDPASFEALDGLANIDFLAGRVDKSRTLYAEYVKKHPRHVQAQFRLLEILVSQENTLGAEQKWREILRLKNKNLDPAITTAFARLYIDKSIPFERNRSTKTIPVPFLSTKYTNVTPAFVRDEYRIRAYNVLQRVLRKYPHFAPAWFQQARLALLRRNLFSAKRSIDMAVKNDAMKPEYHTLLGEILRRQELPEQALKAFRDAIDADPEYLLSHYFLANLIYETEPDNNGGARSEYLQTYELLPSAPPEQRVEVDEEMVYYRLGWLSYNASDYEDAVRMWTLYFKYNELNPAVNLCRGTAHFNLGNYDLAIQDLEAAVSSYRALTAETKIVEPNKPYDQELYRDLSAAYNNLGISYAVIGKTRPALLNLYQSIESIKTLGFFNENEQANVNLQLVLHPTRDSVSQLIPVEQLPRDHILSE